MKRITIITPCYNATAFLDRCWNSIRSQSIGLENLECIFVDDASTDDGATWAALQQIKREAPDSVVLLRHENNLRQGGACNTALQYAGGTYLQFLAADDELTDGACLTLFEYAEQYHADLVGFNTLSSPPVGFHEDRVHKETVFYEINTDEDRKPFLTTDLVTYGCCNKFYRMDVVRRADARFAEHIIYEEPPFVYPQFLFANRILLLDAYLYHSYLHGGNSTMTMAPHRVMEHPLAQLQLLAYLLERPELYKAFYTEIEYYFLWTYLFETILFASREGYAIPPEQMKKLAVNCTRFFPAWHSNSYFYIHMGKELEELVPMIRSFM